MNQVFYGRDCRDMKELPDESVQCVVTSPPYFNARNYHVDGQIGIEQTLPEYIENLKECFKEIHRVLRKDGTVWLNLGDSYWGDSPIRTAASEAFSGEWDKSQTRSRGGTRRSAAAADGLKRKDLMMVPHRVAIALQQEGWYVRSDIVWAKPNPVPESVVDRPTRSHEMLFLLTKAPKYYYDADAIKEESGPFKPAGPGSRMDNDRDPLHGTRKQDAVAKNTYVGFNARWKEKPVQKRNKRDVWFISPKPFKGEHYAVMPWDLVDICIKAGSKPGDLVLDPFMGSGTVAAVAKALGRNYVGYDLSEDYARFLEPRIAEIAAKYAKLEQAA